MVRFSDSFLTELIDRNDIADVVSDYVRLEKKSGANLFGLCPFHNEKTPSFSVSPNKQIYHCFGCGKGGGVINFVMEAENLSFPEAVAFLASRAGMQLPAQDDDAESRRRSRLYAVNKDAARFFYEKLLSNDGHKCRAYLESRKISPAVAKNFGLGYAPDGWDNLHKAMRAKGYTDLELVSADLIRSGSSDRYYDTFRNRLIFPVIDVRGNVLGFSGRILGDGEPKYLNSKETPVFNKGRNLFGLNLAKKTKNSYFLLVEGNVDVVTLHQSGFDSAVASLGTSLTDEQARLISRYTNEVVLAYDSDGAGLKASQRAIGIFEKLDVKVRILRWEGAKDPDDYIKANGAEAFRKLIERSEYQLDYRLANIQRKYNLDIPEDKVSFLREASRLIAGLPNRIEREVYARRLAEITGVGYSTVLAEIEDTRKKLLSSRKKAETSKATRTAVFSPPPGIDIKYSDPASAKAEEGIIRLLYLEPILASAASERIREEDFTSIELGHIFSVLLERIANSQAIDVNVFGEQLASNEISLLVNILQSPEDLSSAEKTLQDYIDRIKEKQYWAPVETDLRALVEQQKDKGKAYKK